MKSLLKTTAIAALLVGSAAAMAAPAQLSDEALSDVTGQDGVALLGNLNLKIDSFVYTNTDATNGGSLSIQGISASGFVGAVLSVVNQAFLVNNLIAPLSGAVAAGGAVSNPSGPGPAVFDITDVAPYYTGGDVLKISMPAITDLPKVALMNVGIDAIRMGATTYDPLGNRVSPLTPSFGQLRINQIDMSGTNIYVFGHNGN